MTEQPPDRNLLGWFFADVRDFFGLLADLVSDDEFAQEMFGFSIDVGIVSRLELAEAKLAEVSTGDADLVDLAELTQRLAEVTEAGRLLIELIEASGSVDVAAEEILGQVLDTAALAHLSAHRPFWLYLLRLLGMLTDNLPQGTVSAVGAESGVLGAWRVFLPPDSGIDMSELLGTDLETEEQARRLSVLLAVPTMLLALFQPLVNKNRAVGVDPRYVQVLYGWDPDPLTTTPDADEISRRFVTVMYRIVDDSTEVGEAEVSFELTLTMAFVTEEHGGRGLYLSVGGGGALDVRLGSGWHLVIDEELANGIEMLIAGEDTRFFRAASATGGGTAELRLERRDEGTEGSTAEVWRIGSAFEARTVELSLRLSEQEPMVALVLRIRDAALTLKGVGGGFIAALLPSGGLRIGFDLGVLLDTSGGLRLEGGSGLTAELPVRSSSQHVQGLHVFLALRKGQREQDPFSLEVSTGLSLRLGCFTVVVDRLGIVTPRAEHALDGVPWMRFPEAIGLGIDGKLLRGGGFLRFDSERGRYAGMLTLTIARFSVNGFGLITDHESGGYSLLVVFTITAKPPVKLGWLEINGIGGIIGHNHGADVRALQAAVRTGAVRTMMFPEDPVAAAPRVLATLADIFPAVDGSSLIGFGFDLGVLAGRFSLVGVFIWESGPASRLLILASAFFSAPTKELDIIRVQVDFAGVIDEERGSLEVDGSLVESRIGPYTLTGDAILRQRPARDPAPGEEPKEDDEGVLLLAVGGFHPAFTPPTSVFIPPQRRVTLALPMENPRLRLELYTAMTSNSLQLGARLEVSARKAGLTAEALLGFDALITLDPFHLAVAIDGRAAIKRGDTTLAGVSLHLLVDGPSPWHLSGTATLDLLFFHVPIPIEKTFGSDSGQEKARVVDPAAALVTALEDPAAWETTAPIGAAALVAVKPGVPTEAGELAAHPLGMLAARQSLLPLGIDVTHLGPARTAPVRFGIGAVTVDGSAATKRDERGYFATGEFVDLTDDEKLSRPAFERFVTGFAVGSEAMLAGPGIPGDLSYEEILLGPDGAIEEPPRRGRPSVFSVVAHAASFGPAASTSLRRDDATRGLRATQGLVIETIGHLVVSAETLVALDDVPSGGSLTEARQALAATAVGGRGQALVVAAYDAEEG